MRKMAIRPFGQSHGFVFFSRLCSLICVFVNVILELQTWTWSCMPMVSNNMKLSFDHIIGRCEKLRVVKICTSSRIDSSTRCSCL